MLTASVNWLASSPSRITVFIAACIVIGAAIPGAMP